MGVPTATGWLKYARFSLHYHPPTKKRLLAQVGLLRMQCPVCEVKRQKGEWMPSQWVSYQPVTEYFNCCKVCAPEALLPAPQFVQESVLEDIVVLLQQLNSKLVVSLGDFFQRWVSEVKHCDRKYWSYFGALSRSLSKGSANTELRAWSAANPKHLSSEDWFDPGNQAYLCGGFLIFIRSLP